MANLHVENVVATGDLDTEMNFSEVLERLELPHLRYDPDVHQGLELRFVEEGPLVTIYATGKYIIRATSIDMLFETREKFLDLFYEKELIEQADDKTFDINNVVGSADIGRELDLEALAEDLDIKEANYDPETFPALRCKLENHKATVLLYRSGKAIVTGADSVESAESTYSAFEQEVDALFTSVDN